MTGVCGVEEKEEEEEEEEEEMLVRKQSLTACGWRQTPLGKAAFSV